MNQILEMLIQQFEGPMVTTIVKAIVAVGNNILAGLPANRLL